ncbi:hypothetical protein RFI_38512, partial [Reticulomyxa filosa]
NNISNSNVICSGSWDNTIRFWDIRSNKNELYVIDGDDNGIMCLKFILLKKKEKTKNAKYDLNLCYEVILKLFDLIERSIEMFVLSTLLFKKLKKLRSMFFEELKSH